MSIIHDALKKTQSKLNLPEEEIAKRKLLLKLYIAFIVVAIIGASFALTTLLYSPPLPEKLAKEIEKTTSREENTNTKSNWFTSPQGKRRSFVLNGIVNIDKKRMALINDEVVKKGDYIEGAAVIDILDDKVFLDLGGKPVVLKIK